MFIFKIFTMTINKVSCNMSLLGKYIIIHNRFSISTITFESVASKQLAKNVKSAGLRVAINCQSVLRSLTEVYPQVECILMRM